MNYVLIIISFVAMGGPKNTTPTIDHVEFQTQAACLGAEILIRDTLKHGHFNAFSTACVPLTTK